MNLTRKRKNLKFHSREEPFTYEMNTNTYHNTILNQNILSRKNKNIKIPQNEKLKLQMIKKIITNKTTTKYSKIISITIIKL